jgi:hypothetical protein
MDFSQVQNSYLRVGELQSIAQQALYQAELAQKALARQVEKERRDQASQVRDLSQSGASLAPDVFDPAPRAQPAPSPSGGTVSLPSPKANLSRSWPTGRRIDLTI